VKKPAPWPSPEEGSFRGPLAMNADELAAFIRDSGITFPVLTPEDKAEVGAEAKAEDEAARADEEYWRLFREEVECIRQLRALCPNTAQLAMSADEITEYCRRATLSPRSEAQRERDLKVVSRLKTGPRLGKSKVLDADRVLAQACLNNARGRSDKAKKAFIKQVCAQDHIKSDRAENRWYEVTEPDGRTRRVRGKNFHEKYLPWRMAAISPHKKFVLTFNAKEDQPRESHLWMA